MGSWVRCRCGEPIHTNLFAGADVRKLIRDSDYDAIEDPVDREKLEDLFFRKGCTVYRCGSCGRLLIESGTDNPPVFYRPEEAPVPG